MTLTEKQINTLLDDVRRGTSALLIGQQYFCIDNNFYKQVTDSLNIRAYRKIFLPERLHFQQENLPDFVLEFIKLSKFQYNINETLFKSTIVVVRIAPISPLKSEWSVTVEVPTAQVEFFLSFPLSFSKHIKFIKNGFPPFFRILYFGERSDFQFLLNFYNWQ